nr:hypothetical protein [Tanacetum cinerariifolium]
MSNTNLQTQSSNALYNAIMEVGGKDRPLMLAPGNYVQWKSKIKRYIDTKPNNELIYYCLQNLPYKFKQTEKTVPVTEDDALSKENEIDKFMALISLSFKKIYKPTNNLRTSSNTNRTHQDNTSRINKGTGYDNQRVRNIVRARENVEEAGIQLSAEQDDWRDDTDDEHEDQELKAHYMYMAKIQEVTPDVTDNSGPIFDTEPLEKIQEVTPDTADNSGPTFDTEPLQEKGSPFRLDSETNESPLRTYQLWKKTFYDATHKLDDMTKLPNLQPKKTYEEDLESNLDKMGDEVENLSPRSSPQVLPSFEEYTPPVT